ncbi:hypothetical protein BDY21DRAFT_269519, partial [Lineolata rhizophorae]
PPPFPRDLLQPLLAFLPTSFVSTQPPPELLPHLTPILRQRVQYSSLGGSSDSWLTKLNWDSHQASKLPGAIESIMSLLEPHPVSGEVEAPEVEQMRFRRLDRETLHSRMDMVDHGLAAIFLWCMGEGGKPGEGWKLAELRCLEDAENGGPWATSMPEAEKAYANGLGPATNGATIKHADIGVGQHAASHAEDTADSDDDDYWNSYDRTPGRTPAQRSPAPGNLSSNSGNGLCGPAPAAGLRDSAADEMDYYAQYAEVQPAMDAHDPDEAKAADGHESTLDGMRILEELRHHPTWNFSINPPEIPTSLAGVTTSAPAPTSMPAKVDILEQTAIGMHQNEGERRINQAEVGVRQHISTSMKSMFRLARAAGIDREEFDNMIKVELELLPLLDN